MKIRACTLAMGLLLRMKMVLMGLIGFGTYIVYKQYRVKDINLMKTLPGE